MEQVKTRREIELRDRQKTGHLVLMVIGIAGAGLNGGLWFNSMAVGWTIVSILGFIWGLVILTMLAAKED